MNDQSAQVFTLHIPDGFVIRASREATSEVLDLFFEGYDRAFVLPKESETLDGFRDCLETNRRDLGPQSELVAVLQNVNGEVLAGFNLMAVDHGEEQKPRISVALNYIYVDEAARGRGLLRTSLSHIPVLARWALELEDDGQPVIIFIEQNDPLAMSAEAYRADTEHSGLDQRARLSIWDRMGARLVDFGYVQPALSIDQEPDDGLAYAVLGWEGEGLPAAFLHHHLDRFFQISVFKGRPIPRGDIAERQLTELARRDQPISLLSMREALEALAKDPRGGGARSFRDLARQRGPHEDGTGSFQLS